MAKGGAQQELAYLRESVGPTLSAAFAEMAIAQPADSAAFLSKWIQQHVDGERAKAASKVAAEELEEERGIAAARREEERKEKAARNATIKARSDSIAKFEEILQKLYTEKMGEVTEPSLGNSFLQKDEDELGLEGELSDPNDPFDNVFQALVDGAQRLTGARGVYLAKVQAGAGEGEGGCLHYTHSSARGADGKARAANVTSFLKVAEGEPAFDYSCRDDFFEYGENDHDFMLDKTMTEGSGVIWDAFEPVGGEEAVEGGDAQEARFRPLVIRDVVEEVTEEKPFKAAYVDAKENFAPQKKNPVFHSVTRLGEMIVFPIVVPNQLTEGALNAAKAQLDTRESDIKARNEKVAELEKLKEEAAAGTAEMPAEEEPLPSVTAVADLPAEGDVKYALVLDSIATETSVKTGDITILESLTNSIKACKSRYDLLQVWQQAKATRVLVPEEEFAAFKKAKDEADAGIEAESAADAGDLSKDESDKKKFQAQFDGFKKLYADRQQLFADLKKLTIVSEEAVSAAACAALFCGLPVESVLNRGTQTPNWEKIRLSMDKISTAVMDVEPKGPRNCTETAHGLAFFEKLANKLQVDKFDALGQDDPQAKYAETLGPMMCLIKAAVELRKVDVKIRKSSDGAEAGADSDFAYEFDAE